jgi:hypothetical protein
MEVQPAEKRARRRALAGQVVGRVDRIEPACQCESAGSEDANGREGSGRGRRVGEIRRGRGCESAGRSSVSVDRRGSEERADGSW